LNCGKHDRNLQPDTAFLRRRVAMVRVMPMVDTELAYEKAIACEAHARATSDRLMQEKFRKLRDSWLRIGNNSQISKTMLPSRDDGSI